MAIRQLGKGSRQGIDFSSTDDGVLESTDFHTPEHLAFLEEVISRGRGSKLLYWEVENFTQYKKERFEFGKEGVLLLKAFNSTGKSNALKALQYCLTTDGISITLAKNMISYGEKEAKITTMWSDGIEIVYHMLRSTDNREAKSVKFTNGYRMYLNKDGVRTEIYNTMINGKFARITEVPSIIKRYFNLPDIDGNYLNFMRKGSGMQVLEQTPSSLNKTLSKAMDTETSEKIIKRIDSDNKDTLQDLNASSNRIDLFTQDIVSRRHLTENIVSLLSDGVAQHKDGEDSVKKVNEIIDLLVSTFSGGVSVKAPELDLTGLREIVSIVKHFEDISNVRSMPKASTVNLDVLRVLARVSNELDVLLQASEATVRVEPLDLSVLQVVRSVSSLLGELDSKLEFGYAPNLSSELSVLSGLHSIQEDLLKLNDFDTEISNLSKSREELYKQMDEALSSLDKEEYNIGVCSHCGHLSMTKPLEVGNRVIGRHMH